jgi:hypothetical protein
MHLLWWAAESVAASTVSLALFIVTITGLALVTVWVGIPILIVAIGFTRAMATRRRSYVEAFRDAPIPPPYLRAPPGGLLVRLAALGTDPATRRDVLWLFVDGSSTCSSGGYRWVWPRGFTQPSTTRSWTCPRRAGWPCASNSSPNPVP